MIKLHKNDTILFLGDSITDCGRDRLNPVDLGKGFPALVAAQLAATSPDASLAFYNRGISGNKIQDILARINEDCLELKPDCLIFLIGINDTWHNVDTASFGTAEATQQFATNYRYFLEQVTASGVKKIMLLEPFVLPYPVDRKQWRKDLDPKIHCIRELAAEFRCTYVPLDGLFAERAIAHQASYYTGEDGVHPTIAGHGVIAEEILKRLTY
jgi:acyl-CoA thioesterase-1